METTTLSLTEENKRKLGYIQQKTNQDLQSAIASAIDAYFQQLQKQKDPLARLKQSPLIASFQGESGLSENSEEIFRDLIGKGK
jgi:type IV secretory pathway VirB4 component